MISKSEITMGRDLQYPNEYTAQIDENIDDLLVRINKVRTAYGKPMTVASGWRTVEINNMTPNAAPRSNHCLGLACDIRDSDGKLRTWVLANLQLLKDVGLWIEEPSYTKNWIHFQSVPPGSRKRVFVPNKGLPPHPERASNYNGKYD